MKAVQWLPGYVYHARNETAKNSFKYPHLNVLIPLHENKEVYNFKLAWGIEVLSEQLLDKKSELSLYNKIKKFVEQNLNFNFEEVYLQTIPKMYGYVFNPVNFWYFKSNKILTAVLCEVNNTFGEKHYYWLYQKGQDIENVWLEAHKVFHVSPFFPIEGKYRFRFNFSDKVHVDIHFLNEDNSLKLVTWVNGHKTQLSDMSAGSILLKYGWLTPLVVIKIHYQALKLFFKKVKFFKKPEPPHKEISYESSLTRR